MGEELSGKLKEYEKKIHESAGETFNINSPKQLGVILFEKLGLPVVKKRKRDTPHQRMFWKSFAISMSSSKTFFITGKSASCSPHMSKGF